MSKSKVLIIIPSLRGGGAERTLINLLEKIDRTKFDITVLSVLKKGVYLKQLPEDVILKTLFKNVLLFRLVSWIHIKFGFVIVPKFIFKLKIKEKFNVGISFLDGNFTDYLYFTDKINKRYTIIHGSYQSDLNYLRNYLKKNYVEKLKRERYSRLDGIRFVSHDTMIEFKAIFGDNYKNASVLYNVLNINTVIEKGNSFVTPQIGKFEFIAIGSLTEVKGFDLLIHSAKILHDKGLNFQLNIYGSGPLHGDLQKLILENNLGDQVKLKGFVENPYPYIKNANAILMSSISEALPTVLCEAFLFGIPAIVTDCPGCRELVDNGKYGIMVRRNPVEYSLAMESLICNKELYSDMKEKSTFRGKLFDDNLIIKDYEELFSGY